MLLRVQRPDLERQEEKLQGLRRVYDLGEPRPDFTSYDVARFDIADGRTVILTGLEMLTLKADPHRVTRRILEVLAEHEAEKAVADAPPPDDAKSPFDALDQHMHRAFKNLEQRLALNVFGGLRAPVAGFDEKSLADAPEPDPPKGLDVILREGFAALRHQD